MGKTSEEWAISRKRQDRKCNGIRQKNKRIKWQPWDSRQEGDIRYPQPPIGVCAERGERPASDKESQVHHNGRVRTELNPSVHSFEFHCLSISRMSLSFEERGVSGNEVEWTRKAQFTTADKACKAVVWATYSTHKRRKLIDQVSQHREP